MVVFIVIVQLKTPKTCSLNKSKVKKHTTFLTLNYYNWGIQNRQFFFHISNVESGVIQHVHKPQVFKKILQIFNKKQWSRGPNCKRQEVKSADFTLDLDP